MAFLILNAAINAFVINRDGSGERPLTFGVRGESPVAWSRDGGRIAFESMDTANRTQIFVFNVNGSGRIPLTTLPGDSLYPAWSPDGRRLAFLYRECTTTGDGTGHIYVANPDGTGLRRVVTEGGDIAFEADSEITWAPDGRRVVFDARSGPSIDHKTWIFAVLVDGGAPARLTPGFSLAWSPDGRRLAYVSSEDGQVTTMNADGTGRARLTPEGTLRLLMRWAPDGRRLAVVSLNPDRRDALELVLDVVNADGSGFRRLTSLALLPVTRPHAMLPIGRLLVDW